jgi:hypothetical protein
VTLPANRQARQARQDFFVVGKIPTKQKLGVLGVLGG